MKAIEELTQAQQPTEPENAERSNSLKTMNTQLEPELEQKVDEDEFSESINDFANSLSYELENEAYRKLPIYLKTHYQIEITERFIRTMIDEEEINLFTKATRHNQTFLVVGKVVMRLDDFAQIEPLEKSIQVVKAQFHQPILPLIVTHFATPMVLEQVRDQGVIVVQSFEWGYLSLPVR